MQAKRVTAYRGSHEEHHYSGPGNLWHIFRPDPVVASTDQTPIAERALSMDLTRAADGSVGATGAGRCPGRLEAPGRIGGRKPGIETRK